VILAEPPPSQGDVHFRLFGFPVRVNPFFWVIAVLLVIRGDPDLAAVATWVVALFVSILVHELGHAFLQRRYGGEPRIVLYGMGGLAVSSGEDRSSRSQILISLAGPTAGFALAMLLLFGVKMLGQRAGFTFDAQSPALGGTIPLSLPGITFFWEPFASSRIDALLWYLLQINIIWGLVNLLPIYPLDGGRISRELCQMRDPSGGIVLSLWISVVAAGGMALFGLSRRDFFLVFMFGYLAYSSFQTLQAYRGSRW